jgi:hypothetical protein
MRIAIIALVSFIALSGAVQAQTPCSWTAQTGSVVETCGKVGVMNPSPAKELDVIGNATISGTLSSRDLVLLPDSGARARLLAVMQGWIGLVSNSAYNGAGWVLDNPAAAGWFARVSTPHDEFAIYRIPPGTGAHTDEKRLLSVQNQITIISAANTSNTMMNVAAFTAGAMSVTGNVHASGNISADGVIYAKYQDLAEWVPATEDVEPGTVVVLNPRVDNEVMPSSRAYDTTVAGVVSAQPGVVLGEASPSKETVATTGRVRVRVDARNTPIAIGDLLVTSDRPGYAMKSLPVDLSGVAIHRPGTIIGKALQPLAGGTGEILVLLSLQ